MIEAFSNAREYCEVGLCVKASNLEERDMLVRHLERQNGHDVPCERHFDMILIHREPQIQ